MNLVAKEYVACRPDLGGVLVLSEFTGAAPRAEGRAAGQPARHRRAEGGHRRRRSTCRARRARKRMRTLRRQVLTPRRRPLGPHVPRRARPAAVNDRRLAELRERARPSCWSRWTSTARSRRSSQDPPTPRPLPGVGRGDPAGSAALPAHDRGRWCPGGRWHDLRGGVRARAAGAAGRQPRRASPTTARSRSTTRSAHGSKDQLRRGARARRRRARRADRAQARRGRGARARRGPDVGARVLDALRTGPARPRRASSRPPGKAVLDLAVVQVEQGRRDRPLRIAGAAAVLFAGDDVTDETAFARLRPGDVGVKVGDGDTAAANRVPTRRRWRTCWPAAGGPPNARRRARPGRAAAPRAD